jgi:hypothetical protein
MPNAYRNGSIHTAIARAQAEYGGFTVLRRWGRGEWTVRNYFVLSGPRVGTYDFNGRWEDDGLIYSFPALFGLSWSRISTEPARQRPYLLPGRVLLTTYNTAGVDLVNRLLPYLGPMKEGIPAAQNSYAVVMAAIEKIHRAKRKARTYVGNSGPFRRPRELDEKRRQARRKAFASNRKRRPAPTKELFAKELFAYGQMEDDYLDDLAMYVIDQLDWRALFLFLLRNAYGGLKRSSQFVRYAQMARNDHALRWVLGDNINRVLAVSEHFRWSAARTLHACRNIGIRRSARPFGPLRTAQEVLRLLQTAAPAVLANEELPAILYDPVALEKVHYVVGTLLRQQPRGLRRLPGRPKTPSPRLPR